MTPRSIGRAAARLRRSVSRQVTASEKGLVVGRIQFNDDEDVIDCTKMGRPPPPPPLFLVLSGHAASLTPY